MWTKTRANRVTSHISVPERVAGELNFVVRYVDSIANTQHLTIYQI